MATQIDFPMLSVNPCKMSHVDSSNVGNLASVWGVFHKCSRSLEDGRRLENMSWRMLNQHTLCPAAPSRPSTPPNTHTSSSSSPTRRSDQSLRSSRPTTPPSSSINTRRSSNASEASFDPPSASLPANRSAAPLSLEKMVSSIREKQTLEPLSPSITAAVPKILSSGPSSSQMTTSAQPLVPPFSTAPHRSSDSSASTAPPSGYESERSTRPSVGSDTSAELMACHSVVRGFSPSQASSSYRSSGHLTPALGPIKPVGRSKAEQGKKSNNVFLLGGSSGDEDDESFDDRMHPPSHQSSLTAGLKRPAPAAKKLSFQEVVEARRLENKSCENEDVFESDDDDDESATEESEEEAGGDDDEAWEDDHSENADLHDRPLFQRVDSKPNLVSRRSLLTSMISQDDRAQAFQDLAMKQSAGLKRSKTSANVTAPTDETMIATTPSGTAAKPIMRTKSDIISLVSSPRTTRRNMLSTEIDENLRKSILHERMQKKSTLIAYTKRVQSARNLPTLPIHSEEREDSSKDDFDYYGHGIAAAYHQTGW